ncbi:uncharacterized protein LOC102801687 [Saccoglossus kowalevskii]
MNILTIVCSSFTVPVSESNIAIQATEDYITINEKTTLTVSCSIENVRPQPELSWLLNNEVIDENNFTVQPDGNLDTSFNVVSNLSLMVTAEDNNKQLECRGGNFITGEYESSFKTLNVTYGPTDITFQLTNCPVLITAEINSNPPAHCIWSYDAEITTNELQLQHKEETTVTCNATNDFGWLTSKETVYSCTSGLSNNAKIGIGVGVGVGGTAVVGGIVFGIVKIVKKIQANVLYLMWKEVSKSKGWNHAAFPGRKVEHGLLDDVIAAYKPPMFHGTLKRYRFENLSVCGN